MTKVKDVAVELKNINKTYILHHEKPTFTEKLIGNSKEEFVAIKNLNLKIFQGEKVGIIGSNGSGKTTLLKIMAGITTPTSGNVKVSGKAVSLIELTAGFHQDLSGEENIFLNALILGISKKEIKQKYQSIIDFADVGKFIDSPLYTYSEGMKLKLGFSIAIHADPDILLLDEGIMAGDANFQKKSGEKIEEFFRKNKTIIVVSHWLHYMHQHCERIIWIDKGEIAQDGKLEVINEYQNFRI